MVGNARRASSASGAPESIALPVRWDKAALECLRLSRRFSRPPIDPEHQSLFLELDGAPGIQSLLLNGKTLTATASARSYYLIELPEIEERNTLVIEVDAGEWIRAAAHHTEDWGRIAILIRPIDRSATG